MFTHEYIKMLREERGMSQEELAHAVGYKDRSSIAKIESGLVDLSQSKLAAFAKALDVTPADLILCVDPFSSAENGPPPAPGLSEDALQVAKDYDGLDQPGQRAVKVVIADQKIRVSEEHKKARSKKHDGLYAEEDEYPRVIPLYYTPAAAGYAQPVFETDFEYIDVGGDVPVYADFAVQIDGDSMEPYIMDGATVYVNRNPLANGDVGIFFCDGDMLCKQYYRDPRGVVWLLSLNRERKDADRRIPVDTGMNLVCYGRVILPVKPNLAVPEEDLK